MKVRKKSVVVEAISVPGLFEGLNEWIKAHPQPWKSVELFNAEFEKVLALIANESGMTTHQHYQMVLRIADMVYNAIVMERRNVICEANDMDFIGFTQDIAKRLYRELSGDGGPIPNSQEGK